VEWVLKNTYEIHKAIILVDFGNLSEIMDWCRQNCAGNWHICDYNIEGFDVSEKITNLQDQWRNWYTFEFDDERDFITFNLRFK